MMPRCAASPVCSLSQRMAGRAASASGTSSTTGWHSASICAPMLKRFSASRTTYPCATRDCVTRYTKFTDSPSLSAISESVSPPEAVPRQRSTARARSRLGVLKPESRTGEEDRRELLRAVMFLYSEVVANIETNKQWPFFHGMRQINGGSLLLKRPQIIPSMALCLSR